jgi:hypothetical protein
MLKKTLFAGIMIACSAASFAADVPHNALHFAPVPKTCTAYYYGEQRPLPLPSNYSSSFPLSSGDEKQLVVTCNGTTSTYLFSLKKSNSLTVSFIKGDYQARTGLEILPSAQCVTNGRQANISPFNPQTDDVTVNIANGHC